VKDLASRLVRLREIRRMVALQRVRRSADGCRLAEEEHLSASDAHRAVAALRVAAARPVDEGGGHGIERIVGVLPGCEALLARQSEQVRVAADRSQAARRHHEAQRAAMTRQEIAVMRAEQLMALLRTERLRAESVSEALMDDDLATARRRYR
jgi:hypothetical protein